ncbi:MAG TPA: transglycosylase SLT domain-containing protein, partial [Saprospiraceae bacterium]|nr:transglycosylase SLT domain-containing protein [Saprospiraceae bacterium]
RYFSVIEPILEQYGIPDDFKYLCVAESNLRMATSPAGAKGLWQFMEPAGKAYGLEINAEVDERYHVEKSTEAACKFILHL